MKNKLEEIIYNLISLPIEVLFGIVLLGLVLVCFSIYLLLI